MATVYALYLAAIPLNVLLLLYLLPYSPLPSPPPPSLLLFISNEKYPVCWGFQLCLLVHLPIFVCFSLSSFANAYFQLTLDGLAVLWGASNVSH